MIKRIMTTDVTTAKEDTNLLEVREFFDSHRCHHLPVTNQEDQVVGIISKLDLNLVLDQFTIFKVERAEEENKKFLRAILAQDIMTAQVDTIGPEDPIEDAARSFLKNKYHCLPVVEGERLIGIITTYDLLKHYAFGVNDSDAKD